MDAYIEKYNYAKATDEDHERLKDDIREYDDDWAEKINLEKLKKNFAALTKKICVKGFPICFSPGYDMASTTIDCLDTIMREGIENRKLKPGDCHPLVFNLVVNCVKTGPGSAHCVLIRDGILSMGDIDFDDYVRGLKVAQLMPLINALKDFKYIPETCDDLSESDQADRWERCTGKLLSLIRGDDSDRLKADQELLGEVLDLGIFYLHKMSADLPEPYLAELERCVSAVQSSDNFYKLVTDNGVMKKNLAAMRKLILDKSFPANETQEKETKHIVKEIIVASKNKNVIVEMWDAINDFLKTLVLDENAEKYIEIIDEFRHSYIRIEKDTIKKNPDMVKRWCPIFTEMLDKGKTKVVGVFAGQIIYHIQGLCTPEKGDITLWMPLLKALLKHVKLDLVKIVTSTLDTTSFKKIWEWKKNWKEGQALIQQIAKIKIDPDAIEDDLSYVTDAYAKVITTILEQFTILKIAENVALDVVELYISLMELGSEDFNSIPKELSYNIPSLKNHKDKIPKLVKRFETMFLDTKYPWTSRYTDGAGEGFINMILDSLSGSKMDSEVTKSFINIFRRCLEEDVEYVEIEYGNATIYSIIIQNPFSKFVEMHCKSDSKDVVKTVTPLVIKMMGMEDEDDIRDMAINIVSTLAESQPEVLENHLATLIECYKETQSYTILGALSNMYKNLNPKSMKGNFQELFAACLDDPSNVTMQVMMLSEAAKKIPEVFTKENVTKLLDGFIQQQNLSMMVLIMVDEIAMTSPENVPVDLFIQQVFQELTLEEYCTHYITKLAVTMALAYKSHADQIMEELFKLCQNCTNYMYTVVLVNGMRSIAEKYGKEKLNPYKEYFENMKTNGRSADEKAAAADVIDFMEGRSLAKVSDDVEVQKKDIKVLDKKVTDTKKTVAVVKTQVKKQEIAITNVKKDVKEVNKRVDVVETDLEETKVKVEEIDNKTMTNAPAWSRDVTKLMNPKAEHDWRLLASRLGYSNKDIKGWATQHDPCMAVLSEWYATHKTVEATHGVLTALQEMNRMDAAAIVENAMKNVEGIVEEAPDYATPPPIFLSYQWGHQNEVKLLRNHLQMAGYECWMDIGQMGGGDKLFEKIDNGIRGAKLIICCVSEKYAKSPNCNREVNLSVNLGKPMIPLLMEKMGWPPKGSMGPIFSEYLFVRFFQRAGEETKDDRYWPVPKFQELLMQINLEVPPDNALVTKDYKEWWKPMAEEIIIVKKVDKGQASQPQQSSEKEENLSPDVFISYQWGKQPQVKQLYRRLTELGFSCWMDIYQMGGGDSLYDKIDRGVRGCKIILSCVTTKYSLSANCRREVSLADAIKKPIIPLLLEKIDWPPTGPMSMVFAQLLFINFYRDETVQMSWKGEKFNELLEKIKGNVPALCFDDGSTKSEATDDRKKESKDEKDKVEKPPVKGNSKQNQNQKPATAVSVQKAKPNEEQQERNANAKQKSPEKTAKPEVTQNEKITPPKGNDSTKPKTTVSPKSTPKQTPVKTPNAEAASKLEEAPKSKMTATKPKDTAIKTPDSKPEETPKSEEKPNEIAEQTSGSKETPEPKEKAANQTEPNQKSSSCILI